MNIVTYIFIGIIIILSILCVIMFKRNKHLIGRNAELQNLIKGMQHENEILREQRDNNVHTIVDVDGVHDKRDKT